VGEPSRLPRLDAFAYYASLGADRSYAAVADHYRVSKTAVTKAAKREKWMDRLRAIEDAARQQSDLELAESMAEMRTRHLKTLRAVHQRALEGLRDHRLSTCAEAVRAIEVSVKLEREIAGDPAGTTAEADAERSRREEDEFLAPSDGDASPGDVGVDAEVDDVW
jgi:hypothetical protein